MSAIVESTVYRPIIIVEGNIGAGKSTLSKQLASEMGYALFQEPTTGNPYLEKYYANPKDYALPMQIWLLKQRFITYCQALKFAFNNNDVNGVVLDRSIFADSVFAEKNFIDGNFSKKGYDCYLELRKLLLEKLPLPDAIVYLNASAKTCADRVNSRARNCESGIPLEYLEGLNTCYENFVDDFSKRGAGVLNLPWETFGPVEETVEQLTVLLDEAINGSSVMRRSQSLHDFVHDKEAVCRLRDSTTLVKEALGPEGTMAPVPWHAETVVTPKPVTRKQIVMESSANTPGGTPLVSPQTPCGQVPLASPDSASLVEQMNEEKWEQSGQKLNFSNVL
jgi:deoxyadenosine/deoxycytidine kinase